MSLAIQPISIRQAKAFTAEHHRHLPPPQGAKFAVAVTLDGQLVGVVLVGHPIARLLDDGLTAEVTRCCTDGTPNAPSKLYGTAAKICRAMGYRRLLTYTLDSEPGTSLKAAGWILTGRAKEEAWDRPSRPRANPHPTQAKNRWEARL